MQVRLNDIVEAFPELDSVSVDTDLHVVRHRVTLTDEDGGVASAEASTVGRALGQALRQWVTSETRPRRGPTVSVD